MSKDRTAMETEFGGRTYIRRLHRDPRMKAVFDGFVSQALIEADQRFPEPYLDVERTRYAARRAAELAMSFVLDNDSEYQMIYAEWERAVANALTLANTSAVRIDIKPLDRDTILGGNEH